MTDHINDGSGRLSSGNEVKWGGRMSVESKISLSSIVTVALALVAGPTSAATRAAVNCSSSAVQTAINSAATGDTVTVPAGSCSWSGVDIPSSKRITLQGAGMNSTTISGGDGALNLTLSGSRVTGIGFVDSRVTVDGDDWRIDHCKFSSAGAFYDAIFVSGSRETTHPRGVIDHNQIQNTRISVIGWNSLNANAIWSQPLALGGGQMVFVEDNTFTGTLWAAAVDGNYGGRFVFRHNSVTDMYIEAHSLQGDTERAIRSWEIYDNTIAQTNVGMWTPFFIRGGTGVVFNNTITGTWGFPGITLDNVRSFEPRGAAGLCDGHSPWDGNQSSNGWPCRDQIGRSTDQWLWTPQRLYPPQASDPAYFWNNTYQGAAISVDINNNTAAWIASGRDYFNNAQKPGYKSYAYPHPLVSGTGNPSAPSAPANLRIMK